MASPTGIMGEPERLPIYVTGHSLGGALATLCALDVASNFSQHFSEIYMYSLASPRVAVGCSDSLGLPVPTLDNQVGFLSQYQRYVPNSYQIVHAADIVPILPFSSIKLGPLTLSCLHVTEPYQIPGSGATAIASLNADGGVANVQVDNSQSTGYSTSFPPRVVLSGGGGKGAIAHASVSLIEKNVEVTVACPGSGYTSAPTVQIFSSGSLAGNVISFCAQTGDIANNHSCANVYVPYLAQLANNFQAS